MESLRGFVRRHGTMNREAFLQAFPHPFLASPPPREKPPGKAADRLFPGAWVLPVRKKAKASIDSRVIVGRERECDLWIDDPSVSKEHCTFLPPGEIWMVEDANSTNGTFINGRPLAPYMPLALRNGDRVGLGEDIQFHFFLPGDFYDLLYSKNLMGRKGR